VDYEIYRHIFFSKYSQKLGGQSARFRKISNFLLGPIIYVISVRLSYCIVIPNIGLTELVFSSSWLVNYLCVTVSVKLLVSEITCFYPLIKTVKIMLQPYNIISHSIHDDNGTLLGLQMDETSRKCRVRPKVKPTFKPSFLRTVNCPWTQSPPWSPNISSTAEAPSFTIIIPAFSPYMWYHRSTQ
jgi:hypothetical protein